MNELVVVQKPEKILKYKTYDSIGHLHESRLGPKDHHIDERSNSNFVSVLPNQQSLVIVQEKLDGTNVTIANVDNKIYALSRSGFDCSNSPQEQHQMFEKWVKREYDTWMLALAPGDRIVGEWLALAHGTIYKNLKMPFVAFDIFQDNKRLSFLEFTKRTSTFHITTPYVVHMGGACSIKRAHKIMAKEFPDYDYEGFVYRLEEKGEFKSIAKYVRPGKIDGLYLKADSPDHKYIWNWRD